MVLHEIVVCIATSIMRTVLGRDLDTIGVSVILRRLLTYRVRVQIVGCYQCMMSRRSTYIEIIDSDCNMSACQPDGVSHSMMYSIEKERGPKHAFYFDSFTLIVCFIHLNIFGKIWTILDAQHKILQK